MGTPDRSTKSDNCSVDFISTPSTMVITHASHTRQFKTLLYCLVRMHNVLFLPRTIFKTYKVTLSALCSLFSATFLLGFLPSHI